MNTFFKKWSGNIYCACVFVASYFHPLPKCLGRHKQEQKCSKHISENSCDSSVGIALGYGLDDRGSRVRFPAGTGNISLHDHVQNGSGTHPTSCPMDTRELFPWG
jgi:hypothetical protein